MVGFFGLKEQCHFSLTSKAFYAICQETSFKKIQIREQFEKIIKRPPQKSFITSVAFQLKKYVFRKMIPAESQNAYVYYERYPFTEKVIHGILKVNWNSKKIEKVLVHKTRIDHLFFSESASKLIFAREKHLFFVSTDPTVSLLTSSMELSDNITCGVVKKDVLFVGSKKKLVQIKLNEDFQKTEVQLDPKSAIECLCLFDDKNLLFTGSRDWVKVWKTDNLTLLNEISLPAFTHPKNLSFYEGILLVNSGYSDILKYEMEARDYKFHQCKSIHLASHHWRDVFVLHHHILFTLVDHAITAINILTNEVCFKIQPKHQVLNIFVSGSTLVRNSSQRLIRYRFEHLKM